VGLFAASAPGAASQEDAVLWIDALRTGTSEARMEARTALIDIGREAVPPLLAACEDPSDWIRWEAVNILGCMAEENHEAVVDAIPVLVERATTDANPHPRWRSLWALGAFPADVINLVIVPLLGEGLDDEEDQYQWYAAVALAFFGQSEIVPRLNRGINREDPFDRWEAVYCLGILHDQQSILLLSRLIRDVNGREGRLRQEAAVTLAKAGDPDAIPALIDALNDPEPEVRWRAALALEKLAGSNVLPLIEGALARETDSFALGELEEVAARLRAAGTGE